MCGIAGYLGPETNREAAAAIVDRMTRTIVHRGPDDGGVWVEEQRARRAWATGGSRSSTCPPKAINRWSRPTAGT